MLLSRHSIFTVSMPSLTLSAARMHSSLAVLAVMSVTSCMHWRLPRWQCLVFIAFISMAHTAMHSQR